MSSSSYPSSSGPEFRDSPPFSAYRYIRKFNGCLDARPFAAMSESGMELTIRDRNKLTRVTAVGARVKRGLHYGGRTMSVSCSVCTAADMPFARCFGEVEYEWALWELIPLGSGRTFPNVGLSAVALRPSFHMIHLLDRMDYWFRNCSFETPLQTHGHPLMVGWPNIEVFAVLPTCRATYHAAPPSWWLLFGVIVCCGFATPPVLAYYSN